jgi:hypothetical protein
MIAVAEDEDGFHRLHQCAHGPFVHLCIHLTHQRVQKLQQRLSILLREGGGALGVGKGELPGLCPVGDYGILSEHDAPSFGFLSFSITSQAYHRRAPSI